MSDVGKIRYWKRADRDKDGMIYFATATNAGHARAEGDDKATEITFEEYRTNVPQQVHNGADREAASQPADPAQAKAQAFAELQEWSNRNSHACTIQDQIAMLALWNHQLCNWAMTAMQQGHRGGDNVQ